MIYYNNENIKIRSMEKEDAEKLLKGFKLQGWSKPIELFNKYYNEQESGERYVFIAEFCGDVAGYTTLLPKALTGPFHEIGIPEISDFNVLIKYRKKGIGNRILDAVEIVASEISHEVSLGVGLHKGYGAAQRIYVKRGYIPDGTGVWFMGQSLKEYVDCNNNDDLILYLSKSLRSS